MTRVEITLFSRERDRQRTLEAMVDTGSVFTWIPEAIAADLGLVPLESWRFRTIDGRIIERSVCDAPVEIQKRRGIVRTVFAKPGDACVLGVTALEILGLTVDPTTGRLREEDATLAFAA